MHQDSLNYRFGRGSDEAHRHDQAIFSELLKHHQQLYRKTKPLSNGIEALTGSDDPKLVKLIHDHVLGMEKRFAAGRAIRSWDPLFAALFEYKDQLNFAYTLCDQGVLATITTDDPKLIELIHCHDQTLHQFVDYGYEKSGEPSPKPAWLD
ncbi:hypothetical protein [Thiomicrospira sp. ALE5]|uniref:hypothetical protein n=1 Tax=Thiomicrospira sp. ALE5 TaxID=748650 RepID=UPI0008EE0003|nr:hypothetical protein [Thiomicrospira sp. ALE5]SFR56501.1 hypothetical protein SAMN03092900_1282 [Thiomicrospira sp. ALE5]